MDGDIFGAVGRLGRGTAEALLSAIQGGGPLDPFLPARCLELVFNAADGIGSLPAVLALFKDLADAPLLADALRNDAFAEAERVVHEARGTVLDRIVLSVAERQLDARAYDPAAFVERCAHEILEHAIVLPRGGVIDMAGDHQHTRAQAHALLQPTAREAAVVLLQRPNAKRLGLSAHHTVDADTDLLGGNGNEGS